MAKASNYQHRRLLKCWFKPHKEQILHKSWQSYALNRTYQYKPFGDKQIKYVGRGVCLKCLSPIGKSSASLVVCVCVCVCVCE